MRDAGRATLECALAGIAALAVFAWWMLDGGGYFARAWMPGTMLFAVVAAVSVFSLRGALPRLSRPAAVAIGALAAYALWSFASIAWAASPGAALEGAQRALAYAVVFGLFAALPWSPKLARRALLAFVAVVVVGALVTLAAVLADAQPRFVDGQLTAPLGYHNAVAALMTMGAATALALACAGERRPPLVAAATLLLGVAVLAQSRGWLFTLPLVGLVLLAGARDRLRLVATALPALVAAGAATPVLLDVHRAGAGLPPAAAAGAMASPLHRAVAVLAVACLGAAVLAIAVDRLRMPAAWRRPVALGLAAVVVAVALGGGLAAAHGDPVDGARRAWHAFKQGSSGGDPDRLATLGSGRYDFWRVGIRAWERHPLGGLGQDNFADAYTRERRSSFEEPRWVHSLPLRLLVHTGLVGLLLFAVWLAALLRAARRHALLLVPGVVWLLHGSIDWLWEFPALTGAVLAFGGMACALDRDDGASAPRRQVGAAALAVPVAVLLVLAPSFWAGRLTAQARQSWRANPELALARARQAHDLNPLAIQPWLVAGEIEARRGRDPAAARAFRRAAERDEQAWYPQLALGLVAPDPASARRFFLAAERRNPRGPIIAEALARAGSPDPLTFAAARRKMALEAAKRRNAE